MPALRIAPIIQKYTAAPTVFRFQMETLRLRLDETAPTAALRFLYDFTVQWGNLVSFRSSYEALCLNREKIARQPLGTVHMLTCRQFCTSLPNWYYYKQGFAVLNSELRV